MFKRKTIGLLTIAEGIAAVAACAVKLWTDIAPEGVFDDYYTYKPPLSTHELIMSSLSLMSLLHLVRGFIITATDETGASAAKK